MQNPKGKFLCSFSRIRNGKQRVSLPIPACSSRLLQPCKWRCLSQLAGRAEEAPLGAAYKAIKQVIIPLIFQCVRCQSRHNKREQNESRAPDYPEPSSPPGFRGRPFLSPLGEIGAILLPLLQLLRALRGFGEAESRRLQLKWRFGLDIAFPRI